MLDRERWFISRSVAIILLFTSVFVCLIRPIFTHRHGTIVDESVEFRNETGDRVSIVVSRYLLLFIHWSNDSSFRQESRQRTFFFCKTKVLSFRGEEEAKFFYWKPWTNIFRGRFGLRSRPGSELLRERINLRWQENRCTYTHRDRSIEWTPAIVEELRFSPTHHQRSFF